jgi:hypothetical protein
LHHSNAFGPVLAAKVSTPNIVVLDVSKLTLDGIRVPLSSLVQKCAGRRPETVAGHFALRITEAAQGRVDRIVRDRSINGTDAWKEEPGAADNRTKLFEEGSYLPRKGNLVGPSHLHFLAGNHPDVRLEIEFDPFCGAEFTGSYEDMRRHSQRDSYRRLPFVFLDGPEESSDLLRLHDGGMVSNLGSNQCILQV